MSEITHNGDVANSGLINYVHGNCTCVDTFKAAIHGRDRLYVKMTFGEEPWSVQCSICEGCYLGPYSTKHAAMLALSFYDEDAYIAGMWWKD